MAGGDETQGFEQRQQRAVEALRIMAETRAARRLEVGTLLRLNSNIDRECTRLGDKALAIDKKKIRIPDGEGKGGLLELPTEVLLDQARKNAVSQAREWFEETRYGHALLKEHVQEVFVQGRTLGDISNETGFLARAGYVLGLLETEKTLAPPIGVTVSQAFLHETLSGLVDTYADNQ